MKITIRKRMLDVTLRSAVKDFMPLIQWGRRVGLWRLYGIVGSDCHELEAGRIRVLFTGSKQKRNKERTTQWVWDIHRKMWYRPLFWILGEWRIWDRGKLRYKYGFGKPSSIMTGPNPI